MFQLKKLIGKLGMGQTQSENRESSSRYGSNSRLAGSIVTVSAGPEQQKRLEENEHMKALSRLPIFLPLYSSNSQYEFSLERTENLNPRIILSVCSHLKSFLYYSAVAPVEREHALAYEVKQLEQKTAVLFHRCNSRYNLLTKIGPHLKRMHEVNRQLKLMGDQVKSCFSMIAKIDDLLTQLENIS